MQPQERFVSPRANSFGHSRPGTVSGTFRGFFDRSVQETEGKRDKATVSLAVAFAEKRPSRFGPAARSAASDRRAIESGILYQLLVEDGGRTSCHHAAEPRARPRK